MSEEEYRRAARERVKHALRLIEQAQNTINDARSELSSVLHMAPEWESLLLLQDRIRAEWYQVSEALARQGDVMTLDEMGRARYAKSKGGKL